MNKRVCLYARTAIYDKAALNMQLIGLDTYADEHDMTVVFRFSESGSGNNINRDGIKYLQRLAQEHKIDAVVVKDVSRLFRDTILYLHFSEIMKRNGVQIISVEGSNSVDFFDNSCYIINNS